MRIEVEKPNIIRIAYHQTIDDPLHGSCLWAYFDFDPKKYMLNVQSEAGSGHFKWIGIPEETFLSLCAGMDGGRLLHELFHDQQQTDVKETVAMQDVLDRFERFEKALN